MNSENIVRDNSYDKVASKQTLNGTKILIAAPFTGRKESLLHEGVGAAVACPEARDRPPQGGPLQGALAPAAWRTAKVLRPSGSQRRMRTPATPSGQSPPTDGHIRQREQFWQGALSLPTPPRPPG